MYTKCNYKEPFILNNIFKIIKKKKIKYSTKFKNYLYYYLLFIIIIIVIILLLLLCYCHYIIIVIVIIRICKNYNLIKKKKKIYE